MSGFWDLPSGSKNPTQAIQNAFVARLLEVQDTVRQCDSWEVHMPQDISYFCCISCVRMSWATWQPLVGRMWLVNRRLCTTTLQPNKQHCIGCYFATWAAQHTCKNKPAKLPTHIMNLPSTCCSQEAEGLKESAFQQQRPTRHVPSTLSVHDIRFANNIFANNIHYKFKSSQASKARLHSSKHTSTKWNLLQNSHSRSLAVMYFGVSGKVIRD